MRVSELPHCAEWMIGGDGKQETTTPRFQAGSVLVVAMLALVLLALLGVAATTTTCIEFHMAGNDRTYVGNFYRAEGAALLGARRLEGVEEGALRNGRGLPAGMNHVLPDADPFCEANWTPEHSETALDQASRYLWVHPGRPAPGSSLDMEGTRLHHFEIYGRSDMNRGTVMVQIGYRKRF